MASQSSAAPLATPAFDLEQGDGHASRPEDESLRYYYCVYGFSLLIVVASIWAYIFPFSDGRLVKNVVGPCGLVIGAFLILNSDLFVTYFRLLHETKRFKENNEEYTASLVQQRARVRELKEMQKSLATLDKICHGHLGDFQEELAELHANAQDSVMQNIGGVLAITRPNQQNIRAGKDLQTVLQVFRSSYIHGFSMIDKRYEEMMKGLEASSRWQEMQSLSADLLKSILVDTFFEDIGGIKDSVLRKVDARLGAVAPGFSRENEGSSGPASAAPKEDSWAEAMAFAGLDK